MGEYLSLSPYIYIFASRSGTSSFIPCALDHLRLLRTTMKRILKTRVNASFYVPHVLKIRANAFSSSRMLQPTHFPTSPPSARHWIPFARWFGNSLCRAMSLALRETLPKKAETASVMPPLDSRSAAAVVTARLRSGQT